MAKDFRDKERLDPLPAEHFFEKHKGRKKGRKEGRGKLFYLTTHFHLRLYSIGHYG